LETKKIPEYSGILRYNKIFEEMSFGARGGESNPSYTLYTKEGFFT